MRFSDFPVQSSFFNVPIEDTYAYGAKCCVVQWRARRKFHFGDRVILYARFGFVFLDCEK